MALGIIDLYLFYLVSPNYFLKSSFVVGRLICLTNVTCSMMARMGFAEVVLLQWLWLILPITLIMALKIMHIPWVFFRFIKSILHHHSQYLVKQNNYIILVSVDWCLIGFLATWVIVISVLNIWILYQISLQFPAVFLKDLYWVHFYLLCILITFINLHSCFLSYFMLMTLISFVLIRICLLYTMKQYPSVLYL